MTSVLATLMGVTWRRLSRSRALWVSLLIASLPVVVGVGIPLNHHEHLDIVTLIEIMVMCILPPVFIASAIGEEIEDRTTTYLWSRPLPRWTIVVGKLAALAPIATALVCVGWFIGHNGAAHAAPSPRSLAGFAAGTLAISAIAAGIATLVPRHGMAISIVYLVLFDIPIGAIPASLQNISITRQMQLISGVFKDGESSIVKPAITMAVIAGVWLAIGLWRVRRLES